MFSFLQNKTVKRIGIALFVTIMLFSMTGITFAQTTGANAQTASGDSSASSPSCSIWPTEFSLTDCASWLVSTILYLLYSGIASLITFFAVVIQFLIELSKSIIESPLVHTGFSITLAIANLGFVLAIIVIAFATILRIEKYALKQTLWKLIVAAVLVNFSLGLAGLIIDFTNVFSYFFIDAIEQTGEGELGAQLANAMQIQNLVRVDHVTGTASAETSIINFGGALLGFIISLLIAVLFGAIIAIVFGALAFMLVVRYIYLIFLLILMPIAWLFWTIPDLSKYWRNWWDKFIQWTFFLPAITFFMYLGIIAITGTATQQGLNEIISQSDATQGQSAQALDGFVIQTGGAEQFLQILVAIGIFVGGLIAAQKMSITGATGAIKMVGSTKDRIIGAARGTAGATGRGAIGAARWTKEKTLGHDVGQRVATRLTRSDTFKKWTEEKQKSGNRLVRGFGNIAAKFGPLQGEELASKASERVKNIPKSQLAYQVRDLKGADYAQGLARAVKEGVVDKIPNLGEIIENEKTKQLFESFGMGKDYGNFEKAAGFNTAMVKAAKENKKDVLDKEALTFHAKHKLKDYGKYPSDLLTKKTYGNLGDGTTELIKLASLRALGETNPGGISKVFANSSGEDIPKIQEAVFRAYESKIDEANPENTDTSAYPETKIAIEKLKSTNESERKKALKHLLSGLELANRNFHDSIKKNLASRILGSTPEEPEKTEEKPTKTA